MKDISKQDIETLVKLQEAETEIVRLQTVLQKIEKEKTALASKLNQLETNLTANREDLESTHKRCRDMEEEIRIVDERIVKSNETLRMVKTNKEYQVLLREVDDNKKRKDALETELLEVFEERETADVRVKESEKEFALIEEQVKAEQAEIDKKAVDDRELLEDYQARQKEIGTTLDPFLMDRFRKISKMNKGMAVAQVRNEVCMGCFMNIPPQLYIEVQRGNKLISCPQCSRILYHTKE